MNPSHIPPPNVGPPYQEQVGYPPEAGIGAAGYPQQGPNFLHQDELTDDEVERSRRNSKMMAIGIAVVVHVIIVAIALFVIIAEMQEDVPEIVAVPGDDTVSSDIQKPTFQPTKRQPTQSSAQVSKVISATAQAPIAVPVIEDIVDDPLDLAAVMGDEIGMNPFAEGSFAKFLPPSMSSRCTRKDRAARLEESGGKPESDEAVYNGLKWLASQQNEDGSIGKQFKASMTGLSLLAFLGRCETPDSKEFGETVTKAMLYLIELGMKKDGFLAENTGGNSACYEHGIATYALCEAYSITKYGKRKFPSLRQVLEKAVPIIIEGQQPGGGWDYVYRKGDRVDLSVAGWQVQALKAAQYTKIDFTGLNSALDLSVEFMKKMQGPEGGFGYSQPEDRITLAGAGALSLIIATGNTRMSEVRKAAEYINDTTEHDYSKGDAPQSLYGWYYNTQACFQVGGAQWTLWNRGFQDELLKNQAENGMWNPEGNTGSHSTAGAGQDKDIFRTALCCLMLEVYYRYLPATDMGKPDGGDKILDF